MLHQKLAITINYFVTPKTGNTPLTILVLLDQLDRAFIAIRNGSQDERLDMTTRVHLLELIELRAKQWHNNESVNSYYVQKLSNLEDTVSEKHFVNECQT